MVKTSPPNPGGAGLIPAQRDKIPHASWPKKKEHKQQKQCCNRFNEVFPNGPCQKKYFFKSLIEYQSGITVLSIADTLLLGIQTQK